MKSQPFGKAWVKAHWKTDTKRHWPKRHMKKRASGASGTKRPSGAPVVPVESSGAKAPHGDSTHRRIAPPSSDVDRSAVFKRPVGDELVSDFKKRLAAISRFQDTGKVYSVIGAARPHPCVVRPKRGR